MWLTLARKLLKKKKWKREGFIIPLICCVSHISSYCDCYITTPWQENSASFLKNTLNRSTRAFPGSQVRNSTLTSFILSWKSCPRKTQLRRYTLKFWLQPELPWERLLLLESKASSALVGLCQAKLSRRFIHINIIIYSWTPIYGRTASNGALKSCTNHAASLVAQPHHMRANVLFLYPSLP